MRILLYGSYGYKIMSEEMLNFQGREFCRSFKSTDCLFTGNCRCIVNKIYTIMSEEMLNYQGREACTSLKSTDCVFTGNYR